jgi:uncharacterized membrane protein HdeD (DUF308 family)
MLLRALSQYWWVTALRGVAWALFGLLVFAMPAASLVTLTLLFGAFVLVDGVAAVVHAVGSRHESDGWWILLLWGLTSVVAGILTFFSPGLTALVLLYYIAAWSVVCGIIQLIAAIRLRQEIDNELWLGLAGLASIAFGAALAVWPGTGLLALLWLVGVYAVALGIALILLAFRTRGLARRAGAA